jgi:hypothetical protein
MPLMNVLDLSIFSYVKASYRTGLRMTRGLKVPTEDVIWKNAKTVWDKLPSSKIAPGFVQASKSSSRMLKIAFFGTQGRISPQEFEETSTRLQRGFLVKTRRSWGLQRPKRQL